MGKIFRNIMLAAIPFALVFLLYFPYNEIKANVIKSFNAEQLIIAKQASKGIEDFFQNLQKNIAHYTLHENIQNMTKKGKEEVRHIYEIHQEYITAVTRIDNTGKISYTYPVVEHVIGMDITHQEHVRKMIKIKSTVVSKVFKAAQGYLAISVAVPVFDKNREFLGSFAVLVDFQKIARKFIGKIKIGKNGYAWLIDSDGTELFCPVPGHMGKNINDTSYMFPSVLNIAAKMMRGEEGTGDYLYSNIRDFKAEKLRKHVAYMPVFIYDNLWSIAVATPESQVLQYMDSFRNKWFIFTAVIIIAFFVYFYFIVRFKMLESMNKTLRDTVDTEIGKREQHEQLMLQQAKFTAMGEMISAIAHQWRQPLSALGMNIQDIEDAFEYGDLDKEYLSEYSKKNVDIIQHMSKTIDDFRNFFSPDKEPEDLDIKEIVIGVYKMVQSQMRNMDIYFTMKCSCEGHSNDLLTGECEPCVKNEGNFVYGYPGELKQVILNLFQNAKDAINERRRTEQGIRGYIDVLIDYRLEGIKVHVRDNGCGIPPDIISKIYDPYFTTKDKNLGSGVGLFMTKIIIEDHMKGRIDVASRIDGTEFSVTLNYGKPN